jgi:aryl-alcohol dehydrogenase-like predicted oxidoreductase
MKYRTLGKTGLRVSSIGLGTMVHAGHFGPMKDSESLSAIDAALELGVNFIDTSDAYGAGYSESLLGQALKGRRDKVMIATKGGNVMVGPDRGKRNFDPDYITRVMEQSLQGCRSTPLTCISYIIRRWRLSSAARSGKCWSAQNKLARFVTSACRSTPWKKASPQSKTAAAKLFRSNTTCSLRIRRREFFALAHQASIGIIARVPLRRGILTGKMTIADEQRFQGEDLRARSFKGEAFAKELAKADELRFLVHGSAKTLGQAAIAFLPRASGGQRGYPRRAQCRADARKRCAADIEISTADLARIAELWRRGFAN